MFFVGINILEVIKLNNEENSRKDEIATGIVSGGIAGVAVAITSFLLLHIWFLLLPPTTTFFAFLIIVVVWTGHGILTTFHYKPPLRAIYRNTGFLVGMFTAIGIMNYFYNILTYDMDLPYNSLRTIRIIALVLIGSSIGLSAKIIAESKMTIKETAQ